MKRDIEKIRDIMKYLEENLEPRNFICAKELPLYKKDDNNDYLILSEYIKLLEEDCLVETDGHTLDGNFYITRITSQGHDFLDTLRSDNIWNKTAEKAKSAGVSSLGLLAEIGKEVIKKELGI